MTPEEIKILASNLRFQKRYTVGQVPVTMDAAADTLDTLLDRLEKAEKDAARYARLTEGKRRKYIWNHVLTDEEKEGHNFLEQVLDAMEASK